MTIDIQGLIKKNQDRWSVAKITRESDFMSTAVRLVDYKARYDEIEADTGVPWWVVAVIHEREASQNFSRSIAQGDRWDEVSVNEPRGRGPFKSFKEAAHDALVNCPPFAARWKDWSAGGAMTLLERYNGLGYAKRGIPSPYIWSGTDQYVKGKYVRDGVFDPDFVDKQLGCAGLVLAMQKIDPTIVIK
jgi:lysozyme family protein